MRNILAVHDSFACLAPRAEQLNGVIREQLEAMYDQHDPLTEIRERALCGLATSTELRKRGRSVAAAVGIETPNFPEVPKRGSLDLRECIKNVYAFS
jgi:DNA-directed RNA polymerase